MEMIFYVYKNIDFQKDWITVVYRTVASNGTCDSVRRVIALLGFGFQTGHLFILYFFLLFLIKASPFGC